MKETNDDIIDKITNKVIKSLVWLSVILFLLDVLGIIEVSIWVILAPILVPTYTVFAIALLIGIYSFVEFKYGESITKYVNKYKKNK